MDFIRTNPKIVLHSAGEIILEKPNSNESAFLHKYSVHWDSLFSCKLAVVRRPANNISIVSIIVNHSDKR